MCGGGADSFAREACCWRTGAIDTVATVGTCDVHPGAVNSVPSRVVLQVDMRDTDPGRREGVMQAVRRDCEEIRQRRGVTIDEELVNADEPAQSSPHIVDTIARRSVTKVSIEYGRW